MQVKLTKQVNVFSEQEKQSIISEFEYYNIKKEKDPAMKNSQMSPKNKDDITMLTDPFAE